MLTVNRPTALGLSALFHGIVLFAGLIVWPFASKQEPIHITPITLMKSADIAPLRAAEQAPAPQEEQTPTPAPPAPVTPPPPPPRPEPAPKAPTPPPAPPKAAPAPKPVAKAPPPPPTKVAVAPSVNTKPVNLEALAKSLAQTAPSAPIAKPTAPPGPTQAEKDAADRVAQGQARAATANALQAIGAKIADNWTLNCPSDVSVTLRLELSRDGALLGAKPVNYASADDIPDPKLRAAAINAVSAARAAAPFSGLPEQTYADWRSKTYEFRASDVCADRLRKR